jgi:hypothetical protein
MYTHAHAHYLVEHSVPPHPSHIAALFDIIVTIDSLYSLNSRKWLVIVTDIDHVFCDILFGGV